MKKIAVVSFISLFSALAYGADGSSGCGPGWYLFKDNSLLSSSFRTTTNSVLFPVTTIGMTIGTSNCTQHKLVLTEKESLHFASNTYFELKNDIAQGKGEYLQAYAQTIGCKASTQSEFNSELKKNFNQVVPAGQVNPEQMLLETYKIILTNPRLVQSCSLG